MSEIKNLNFIKNLKAARKEKGFSQARLAEKADIPTRTYQDYEYGITDMPLSKAIAISKVLGRSLDSLAGITADHVKITKGTGSDIDLLAEKIANHLIKANKPPPEMQSIIDLILTRVNPSHYNDLRLEIETFAHDLELHKDENSFDLAPNTRRKTGNKEPGSDSE